MTLLICGLLLWSFAHFFKRLFPEMRARMGDKGRGIIALLIVVSVIMMWFGFKTADHTVIYSPPHVLRYAILPLMLIALFLVGMSATTGRLRGRLRHPMLMGVMLWAASHLMVKGDLAALTLFGGMFVWALFSILLINAREKNYVRPEPGAAEKDTLLIIMTVVSFSILAFLHPVLGANPFP